ncbi:MAG TPA: tRNA (adenosine(37)-N6)-dimethylallyltransferase MiaA [Alphaproteobacteria bacterium]|nr:tRNA (adenosine(37)-N6)-dimethylallyltransferase MiaA [Alphaproteobacteria bacterium]
METPKHPRCATALCDGQARHVQSGSRPSAGRGRATAGEVVVIGGPTASGKSGLALDLARVLDGVVINADSMQVYRELSVLTARPGPADMAHAPHRLYGVLSGEERCSVARWRAMSLAEIDAAHGAGKLPIVVGGTGLYLRALMAGLADIPEIPEPIRAATGELFEALGGAAFHDELRRRDPKAATRLPPGDRQRLVRAFEVMAATGRSIVDWQNEPAAASQGLSFHAIALMPEREPLYAACNARFLAMMDSGALDEVRDLAHAELDPSLPVMKALGVPELLGHLAGNLMLDEAVAAAQQATRRYAKRQLTWFRHQWPGAGVDLLSSQVLPAQYSGSGIHDILAGIGRGEGDGS